MILYHFIDFKLSLLQSGSISDHTFGTESLSPSASVAPHSRPRWRKWCRFEGRRVGWFVGSPMKLAMTWLRTCMSWQWPDWAPAIGASSWKANESNWQIQVQLKVPLGIHLDSSYILVKLWQVKVTVGNFGTISMHVVERCRPSICFQRSSEVVQALPKALIVEP